MQDPAPNDGDKGRPPDSMDAEWYTKSRIDDQIGYAPVALPEGQNWTPIGGQFYKPVDSRYGEPPEARAKGPPLRIPPGSISPPIVLPIQHVVHLPFRPPVT
jgi:hypothetical protein